MIKNKYKNGSVFLFEKNIYSIDDYNEFYKEIETLVKDKEIDYLSDIFVYDLGEYRDREINKSLKKIDSNIYRYQHYSGKNQHYIQRYFIYSYFKLWKGDKNVNLYHIKNYEVKSKEDLILDKNKDSLSNVASRDNFFSKDDDCFLDRFISAYEEDSKIIIQYLNNFLSNNKNENKVKMLSSTDILNNLVLPIYVKNINPINFENSIYIEAQREIDEIYNIDDKEKQIIEKIFTSRNSNQSYKTINNNIKMLSFLENKIKFKKVKFINTEEKLPLSENLTFFIDNGKLSIDYNENCSGVVFIFNENEILYFYDNESINVESWIKKNIKKEILKNANDFVLLDAGISIDLDVKIDKGSNKYQIIYSEAMNNIELLLKSIRSNKGEIYSFYYLENILEGLKNDDIYYCFDSSDFLNKYKIITGNEKSIFTDKNTFERIKKLNFINYSGHCYKVVKIYLDSLVFEKIHNPLMSVCDSIFLYEREYENKKFKLKLDNNNVKNKKIIEFYVLILGTPDEGFYTKRIVDDNKKNREIINYFEEDKMVKKHLSSTDRFIETDINIVLKRIQSKHDKKYKNTISIFFNKY